MIFVIIIHFLAAAEVHQVSRIIGVLKMIEPNYLLIMFFIQKKWIIF